MIEQPKINDLRVWWIPQVPGEPFYVEVASPREAKKLLQTLADYDQFQLDNNIKPDYCNAGGLEVFEAMDDGVGEWCEWCDEDTGDDIDHTEFDAGRENMISEDAPQDSSVKFPIANNPQTQAQLAAVLLHREAETGQPPRSAAEIAAKIAAESPLDMLDRLMFLHRKEGRAIEYKDLVKLHELLVFAQAKKEASAAELVLLLEQALANNQKAQIGINRIERIVMIDPPHAGKDFDIIKALEEIRRALDVTKLPK